MPKLNAVLMVLLSAGVIGGMGWWVLGRGDDGAIDRARTAKVLRKLADADPDLRREAAAEIKAMGPRGKELLKETAKAADVRLAERAVALLKEMEPAPAIPEAPLSEQLVSCSELLHIEFRNAAGTPILIALEKAGEEPRFGWFEIEDAAGQVRKIGVPSYAPPVVEGPAHIVALPPGARQVLYHGEELLRTLPHPCKVRFVYDASAGSPYRDLVKVGVQGVPLRPGRHVSAAVDVP